MYENKSVPGELIRMLRNVKGLKQEAVAINMGKKQQYVSKLESAQYISETAIAKLLTALNSNKEELEQIREL